MRRVLDLAAVLLLIALPRIATAEESYFDSKGVKIAYSVEGEGEPVVLIHGFTGSRDMWNQGELRKNLARQYRVIAIDCRGHGKSDKPHDPALYGAEMANDVVRLLDHLKVDKAHVIGYSMGGFITLKLLTDHPGRVRSAVLGGAGMSSPADGAARENIAKSLEEGKGLAPLIERLTPPGRPKPTEEQIRFINQALLARNDVKALAAVMRGMKDLSVPADKLKNNSVPTLALIGELDPLKAGVDVLKTRKPGLTVVVIEGADHGNAFGRPEFLKNVQEFLARQPLKKAA